MNELINALAPLIAAFVKDHLNRKGTAPTDDEVKVWLQNDAAAVEAISNAWLAQHPKQVNDNQT